MTDAAPLYEVLRDSIRAEEPVALATVVEGPNPGAKLLVRPKHDSMGTLGNEGLDRVVARDSLGALEAGLTATRHYGPEGEARQRDVAVFVEAFAPPPQMIIFGAVDFTAALA
ncbi:MAG: XdhC family protein, partial [Actinobacteria bacterium]|nr:XdhC family protein [Actinomycetota bacterium]